MADGELGGGAGRGGQPLLRVCLYPLAEAHQRTKYRYRRGGGRCAAAGRLGRRDGRGGPPALLFFAIIFFWTPAHFWALALVDKKITGRPAFLCCRWCGAKQPRGPASCAMPWCWWGDPAASGRAGPRRVVSAGAGGLGVVSSAGGRTGRGVTARAWRLFKFSNMYLALLYLAMVVDRLLAWTGGRDEHAALLSQPGIGHPAAVRCSCCGAALPVAGYMAGATLCCYMAPVAPRFFAGVVGPAAGPGLAH